MRTNPSAPAPLGESPEKSVADAVASSPGTTKGNLSAAEAVKSGRPDAETAKSQQRRIPRKLGLGNVFMRSAFYHTGRAVSRNMRFGF